MTDFDVSFVKEFVSLLRSYFRIRPATQYLSQLFHCLDVYLVVFNLLL